MKRASVSPEIVGGVLVALVAGALFLQDVGRYPFWDPDEARHAEVAREMASAHGIRRLLLPTLDLEPYHEKPAGYYWLVTLAYDVAGVGEAPARAISGAAGLVAVLMLYLYALPRAGVAGAVVTGLVAATSFGWFALARFATLDMLFTACVTVGVLGGLDWLERPASPGPMLAPFIAAGIGTLVKGPLAVVLVGVPLALAVATAHPRPPWRAFGLARGVAVMVAIAALLYVPVGVLDPSYLSAFAQTNLRRLGAASPHAAPFYYYLLWLPVLFLPWTLVIPPAVVRAVQDPRQRQRALLLWAGAVPAVLSLARGKLATYALSTLAPLALLVGPAVTEAWTTEDGDDDDWFRIVGWVSAGVLVSAGGGALLLDLILPVEAPGRALLTGAALGWAAVLAVVLQRARPGLVPGLLLGACLTIYPLVVHFVLPAVSALHSDRDAAHLVAAAGPAPVVAFGGHAHSFGFYVGAPTIQTEDPELVRQLFARNDPVFLVTGEDHFEAIEALLGERAFLWHATPRRRLYANHPRPVPEPLPTGDAPQPEPGNGSP
jgi:4-amino-4-deoxy-L-arabinose transferase-like glycosyltransferase